MWPSNFLFFFLSPRTATHVHEPTHFPPRPHLHVRSRPPNPKAHTTKVSLIQSCSPQGEHLGCTRSSKEQRQQRAGGHAPEQEPCVRTPPLCRRLLPRPSPLTSMAAPDPQRVAFMAAYSEMLRQLKAPDKVAINTLSMLAGDNKQYLVEIVTAILQHIMKVGWYGHLAALQGCGRTQRARWLRASAAAAAVATRSLNSLLPRRPAQAAQAPRLPQTSLCLPP